ncbi:hypothetical protein KSF78_0007840 [Schistosoma japonicum]|nr:hypothetical protein KSF78_0007840 [Schistosoma japonicum]
MAHIEEFDTMSENNVSNISYCLVDHPKWSDEKLITGVVCITVGFIIELLIVLIKRLRSQSVINNLIMIFSHSLGIITCIAFSIVTLILIFGTAYYFKFKFDRNVYSILYVTLILWSEFYSCV